MLDENVYNAAKPFFNYLLEDVYDIMKDAYGEDIAYALFERFNEKQEKEVTEEEFRNINQFIDDFLKALSPERKKPHCCGQTMED